MSNLKVVIWYNQQVEAESLFAQGFSVDIQKCLARFLPNYNIEVLHNAKGERWNFHIQSADNPGVSFDSGSKSFHYLVQIEPIDGRMANNANEQYLFWEKHYETDEVKLYRRDYKETRSKYWEKLTDIAIAIRNGEVEEDHVSSMPKVYLSLDDNHNNADRENIKRDLSDLGYQVIPNSPLSSNFSECTQQIDQALRGVQIVIHLIPPVYTIHFPESHLSLTEHQCNRSAQLMGHGDEAPLRIIWISSAYDITDEENQIFIEKIQRDQSQTKGSIVLKSSIEDLKKYYRQKVALSTSPLSQPDDSIDVYLVSDDSLCEQKVIKELGERRVSASSHINNISYTQHLRLLSKATSVVVCNTSNNPKWLAVKANDVLKSKGIDRAKQFEKVILYKNDKALDLETPEGVFTDVVDNLSDLHKIFNQSSNK
jgi:hypothetical protein